jgi:predicted AAA+ superfamily ATPase
MKSILRNLSPLLQGDPKSVLILGPRQVGKSTLLRSLHPSIVVNLASEREFFRFSSEPGLLETILEGMEKSEATTTRCRVLIDEIQRIPALLNSVQFCLDEEKIAEKKDAKKSVLQFLLSGSSARKLKRGQANLAPGRLRIHYLGGLTCGELQYRLDVERALILGTLPEPYLSSEQGGAEATLRDYSATYLKEEIQAEALTRNLQGFARVLNILAESSGNVLDLSKVATKAKVARTSVVRFIEILEDTLIAERIWCYCPESEVDTIKHPKLYFFDPGVLNGLMNHFSPSPERRGILFEHLVLSQIRFSAWSLGKQAKFHYFRTRHGREVDFVIELPGGGWWALEVKAGPIQEADLKPLLAFRDSLTSLERKRFRFGVVSLRETRRRILKGCLISGLNELLKEMGL